MGESLEKKGGNDLRSLVESESFKLQVAKALPKHLTPDRFIRISCTALMRTPKLMDCEQISFFNALLSLSQLGLEPDGRRAHLIPFNNTKRGVTECQLIVDYKGLVELAMRSGNVANIHADVVCDNDEFVYDRGQITRHAINFKKERGKVYAAYATVRFKDGTEKTEVMSKEEVELIKGRSKAGSFGPWQTDWNEMAKKTVFRRLSKWITLSPEYHDILEKDFDSFENLNTPSAKASILPPPLKIKEDEPKFEEKIVKAEATPEPVQSLKDKIKQDNPAIESEPPDREPGQDDDETPMADDIFSRLNDMVRDRCNGNEENMAEVYDTITGFDTADGRRSCKNIADVKRWKKPEGVAAKAKRKLEERMGMGTKFKFELE